jgi:hypothetical protein
MKRSTFLMRLLSVIAIAIVFLELCLMPEITYASSKSEDSLDSESGGSESKTVNTDNTKANTRVLDCRYSVHKHSKDCYDAENNIICGYADYVIHTHDKNCYNSEGKLVCKLPEIEEHTHSEDCYGESETENEETIPEEIGDTVIIMEEPIPLKTNSDGREITCGKDEAELHTHTMICLDYEGNIVCGKLETLSHQHTDACFKTVRTTTKKLQSAKGTTQQTTSQTINYISTNETNAQITENSETESQKPFWAFRVFGIIILILAAALIGYCIIYKRKRRV